MCHVGWAPAGCQSLQRLPRPELDGGWHHGVLCPGGARLGLQAQNPPDSATHWLRDWVPLPLGVREATRSRLRPGAEGVGRRPARPGSAPSIDAHQATGTARLLWGPDPCWGNVLPLWGHYTEAPPHTGGPEVGSTPRQRGLGETPENKHPIQTRFKGAHGAGGGAKPSRSGCASSSPLRGTHLKAPERGPQRDPEVKAFLPPHPETT